MNLEQLYPLLFPASYFLALVIERLVPQRAQPKLRVRWVITGIVFFMIGGVINSTLPELLGGLVAGHTLLDLSVLGTVGGALVGLVASELLSYWQHRLFHRSTLLWRGAHQLHHAAERVDIAGFAFTHPLELAFATTVAPVTALALGVTPHAAMLAGYLAFAIGLVTHMDLRTPRWLGYLIQRPEGHAVHHQRGVHAYNYGLPLWDIAFGTYRNPVEVTEPAGFWDGASREVGALLIGRDVSTPPDVGMRAQES
jgi:sterol desaturase/sphingolipid hydroxylase (fatty acid hydroxylase superfamily)